MSAWSTPNGLRKKGQWVYLSKDLQTMYLSAFARFGEWSPTCAECYDIPPAVQEAGDGLRARFLALAPAIRDAWVGDFPAPAPRVGERKP